MRYISIKNLTPDMVLATTLYDNNDNVLLKANHKLTPHNIKRIKKLDYDGLYIYEDEEIAVHNELISEQTRINTLRALKRLNIEKCLYLANEIVDEIRCSDSMLVETINLSSYDNYTYIHSINVDVLSVITGIALGLTDNQLRNLSQAALLHDLGKTSIPKEIINKPGALTEEEYEEIKKHPYYGYELLKDNDNIASVVRNAVYSHHENEDGTGYPRGLTSDKIHLFAKIIHIADVYDALTAKRIYKDPLNPADALEYMMAHAGTMFDKTVLEAFIRHIAPYPVGTSIILSTGQKALVVKNNEEFLTRPIVKLDNGTVINLQSTLNITITELLTNHEFSSIKCGQAG